MSLEQTKAFYQRIASDETFRSQFQNLESHEEFYNLAKQADYEFSEQEFETYTHQLLEAESLEDAIQDLNEEELVSILGGFSSRPIFRPKYGSVKPPILVRPMYGLSRPRLTNF